MIKTPLEELVKKQTEIMSYIKQDEETARKLAESKGDISKIRTILKQSATDDFINGIVDSTQYEVFVFDMVDKIMNDFPGIVGEVQDKELGIKPKKAKPKKPKKPVKKYTSRTATGKTYKKSYKKWSDREITFLESRKNKPISEVVKEYNKFFNDSPRTKSSITTKYYRVR